ncbi:hypothetical protein [Lactococcus cremoris]|uniref:hypothetical protein n=1 Tax=Lactococcus lactis subsp. cremoris TaxID=1359 RepID=UPI0024A785B3|nr:hypothetical protein [Lactococcus cremoris]WKC57166.1 hypothetical protein LLUC073_14105 [Lactococcus cremoris]
MNKSKIIAFSAVSLSVALLLTACGNSSSKSEQPTQKANYSFASNILTLDTSMALMLILLMFFSMLMLDLFVGILMRKLSMIWQNQLTFQKMVKLIM